MCFHFQTIHFKLSRDVTLCLTWLLLLAAQSIIPQAVLQSRPRPPSGFADPDAPKALSLSPGSRVVWVGANYFGCVGTVLVDPAAKITGKDSCMGGYIVRLQVCYFCVSNC
jgi:hypothetical protein